MPSKTKSKARQPAPKAVKAKSARAKPAKAKSAKTAAPAKVKPVPEGMRTVTPHLVCDNASAAIEFYKIAFGATEVMRLPGTNGKLMHASIRIGDSAVFLVDEMPDWGVLGPKSLKGSTVTIHLSVPDADAWFDRAVKAGATVKMPLNDTFWGDRYGILADPFGHAWSVATHIRDVAPEDLQKAMEAACAPTP